MATTTPAGAAAVNTAPPTPVTIITGFLGSGKTTLILNLIPQLPKNYKLALLKNEFGDVAVDSQLAASKSISGVQELLNGCICCNLVGQLSDALFTLRNDVRPHRIVIETSGSAFPATLAMEVNRVGRENPGTFVLDGVISVIDVENWKGYDDTSYTAKMQAKYTDLIVFNKWELVDEMAFDRCLDRVGDLEVQFAWVKSKKGFVDSELILGVDGAMVLQSGFLDDQDGHDHDHDHDHNNKHKHAEGHQEEVEVLSVTLTAEDKTIAGVKLDEFEDLLLSAPKDEVYRIKGLIASSNPPPDSSGVRRGSITATATATASATGNNSHNNENETDPKTSSNNYDIYVLNWAFSRWTYTALDDTTTTTITTTNINNTTTTSDDTNPNTDEVSKQRLLNGASARLTFILARGEANKWKKKLEKGDLIELEGGRKSLLHVKKIAQ